MFFFNKNKQRNRLNWLLAIALLVFGQLPTQATPTEPTNGELVTGCSDITFGGGSGSIIVQGLSAPVVMVQVFNSSWAQVYNCAGNCSVPTQLIPNLPAGVYYVKASLLNADWTTICTKEEYVTVYAGNSCNNVTNGGTIGNDQTICPNADPAAISNTSAPSGGSGQLEYVWLSSTTGCPEASSSLVAGATSESYDPGPLTTTTWFRRCSRRAGCTDFSVGESNCVKITVDANNNCGGGAPNCSTVSIAGGNGAITVSNLSAPIVLIQAFNASWSQVFSCSGNCSTPTQTISSLPAGQYYVKVDYLTAQWSAICSKDGYVQVTTGGGQTAVLTVSQLQNITVSAPFGQNTAQVTFGSPTASTTCPGGAINLSQTAGSASGSAFPIGVSTITYTATDNCGNVKTISFTITVSASQASAPVANNDNATTGQNTSVTISPLTNDNLNGGTFQSIQIVSNPSNGFVSVNGSNVQYTPNAGFSGTDAFTYRIIGTNGQSNVATVSVAVQAAQNPPVANNDNVSTNQNTSTTISPLTNDNLNGGTFQSIQIVSNPSNGFVSVNGSNIVYTPNANFFGNDFFTYRIISSNGTSNAATVSVSVSQSTLTNSQPQNITVTAATGQSTVVVNYTAPTATTTCAGGAVNIVRTGGLASGSAFPIGTTTVTYQITDNCGNSRTVSFTVTVNAAPAPVCTFSTVAHWTMNGCASNTSGSNADFSEFGAVIFSNACTSMSASKFSVPAAGGTHSCTAGFAGNALCIGGSSSQTANATDAKMAKFTLTVGPNANGAFQLGKISFYEKAPTTYSWIGGSSGANKYPQKFAIRVLKNGVEIFNQTDIATARSWTLREFDLSGIAGASSVVANTVFEVQLLSYAPISSSASVSAWDLDEIKISGCCSGTNPNGNNGCHKKIAFYCANPFSLTSAEAIIKTKLELLGYLVDIFDDHNSHSGQTSGYGTCLVSSSCVGSVLGWVKNLVLPVVCLKRSLLFDWNLAYEHGTQNYWSWDNEHCNILGGSGGGLFGWLWGGMSSGHKKLFDFNWGSNHDIDWARPNHGSCAFRTEVPYNSTRCRTFGYAQGASMCNGFSAPHRRIGLCFGDNKAQYLNNEGWTLFLNAIKWGADCENLDAQTNSSEVFTFAAHRDGFDAKLKWVNNSGDRNDFFSVERSADEKTWEQIDQVDGKGATGEMLYFDSRDSKPFAGDNFYRLKLMNRDGSFRFSEVQKLNFESQPGTAVFPNPAADALFVELSDFDGLEVELSLVNVFGQVVRTESVDRAGQSAHQMDIRGVAEGHYLLNISAAGRRPEAIKVAIAKL